MRYRLNHSAAGFRLLPALFVTILLTLLGLRMPQASAQIFTNLHNFVFTNGTYPQSKLLLVSNVLYGTTREFGGGILNDGYGRSIA